MLSRSTVSVVIIGLLFILVGSLASAAKEPATTAPAQASATASPGASIDAARPSPIVLGSPGDLSVGGWREVGRMGHAPDAVISGRIRDGIAVVGDRLVSVSGFCAPDDGPCWDVSWHTTDGVTWSPGTLPGVNPQVTGLAVTSDGLIAVGYVQPDWNDEGAIWSTSDGIDWSQMTGPPVAEVSGVAVSDGAVVVSTRRGLWASTDMSEWTRIKGPKNVFGLVSGPGGFLAWSGGGQDRVLPTRVWRSVDGFDWAEVKLPKALRKGHDAFAGIDIFGLEDQWVLVPDNVKLPKTVFVSADGERWRSAPRPPRMIDAWWMADIGGQVQAGGKPFFSHERFRLWSWQPGRAAHKPDALPRGVTINEPVAWHDGHVAFGSTGTGSQSLWRWEQPAGEHVEVPELGVAIELPLGWEADVRPERLFDRSRLGSGVDEWRVLSVGRERGRGGGSCTLMLYRPTDLTAAEAWDRSFGEEGEAPSFEDHGDGLIGMTGPGSLLGGDADMATYMLGTDDAVAMLWCMAEKAPKDHWLPIARAIELEPADEVLSDFGMQGPEPEPTVLEPG
jgi:hypothetical protein